MGKRWLVRIVAALVLMSMPAAVLWRGPVTREGPELQPDLIALAAAGAGKGCSRLAELEPVDLVVRLPDRGTAQVGVGFWETETDRVLAPVRRVVTPLAPGPWGVFWDETNRTASLLREGQVLSIHVPEGRDRTGVAVLNGEVVGAETILCEERLYVSLGLLAEGLNLRYRWRDAGSILVEPR